MEKFLNRFAWVVMFSWGVGVFLAMLADVFSLDVLYVVGYMKISGGLTALFVIVYVFHRIRTGSE